jgi:hypothetical protein
LGDKGIYKCGFTHPGFAGDKDDLALSPQRLGQGLMELG